MSRELCDLVIIAALGVTAALAVVGIGHYGVEAYDKLISLWRDNPK